MTDDVRPRRWLISAAGAVVLLLAGAACAWAAMTLLRPAEDPLASTDHTYVRVESGEVGAAVTLNTVAEWTQVPVGTNQAAGIVTSVNVDAGSEVAQGTTLFTVGLRPVVAAQGAVPMFREIASGTEGEDVKQLQQLLAALGHYGGALDGKSGGGTVSAIKAWQGTLGMPKTGVVEPGDVIFLPQVPTRVALDTEFVHRGANLAGGEAAVLGLSASPRFWIPLTETQASVLPAGSPVEVSTPDGSTWAGVLGEQLRSAEESSITAPVTGRESTSLCGDTCSVIPPSGQTTLLSKVITVEKQQGLVVPSSALVTNADGSTAVIGPDDDRVAVKVVASAKGMSIVTGAPEGMRVRVPASDEGTG